MTEVDFKKILIATIEQSNYDAKHKVLGMIRTAGIEFDKTNEFTRNKWNFYKEYIYILVPLAVVFNLKKHEPFLNMMCKEVYMPDGDYEFSGVRIKVGNSEVQEVSQEIIFEDIRSQIIVEIQQAKYLIWIAMAWFTDKVLYKELLSKKEQGLTIAIVLDDNQRNRNASFDISGSFPTYWVAIQSLYPNLMHDKFCIIDLQTVIHGTFNWTPAANYNKETISIDKNRATSEKFADEFMKLKHLALING